MVAVRIARVINIEIIYLLKGAFWLNVTKLRGGKIAAKLDKFGGGQNKHARMKSSRSGSNSTLLLSLFF